MDGAAEVPDPPPVGPPRSRRVLRAVRGLVRVLRSNGLSFVGFVLVVLLLVILAIVAIDPHLLVPYGPTQNTGAYSSPPTIFHSSGRWSHPFGTDGGGLDIYSEVMLALPLDVGIAVLIAGAALLSGGTLGLIAGFWDRPGTVGGYTSVLILRITDVFLAFPSMILGLAIVAALGPGVWQVILAVLLTWWPYYVRLVRGEVLAVKHLPYIVAARAAGVSERRILLRHVLRNVIDPLVVYFTLDIGTVLVTFSTISYVLPRAIPYPRIPEWGSMMSFYYVNTQLSLYWWTITFPAIAIFIAALSFSLLGDGLRDVLDPRSRHALAEASASPTRPPDAPEVPGGGSGTTVVPSTAEAG